MFYIISQQIYKNKIPRERLLKEFQYETICGFIYIFMKRETKLYITLGALLITCK